MAGQQRGRRGGGGGNSEVDQLARQLARFLTETGSPQVFPDQNPRGGGQPSFSDPQGEIRKDRMISDLAGQVAYVAADNANLRRDLARLRQQRQQRPQRQQQGQRF